MNYLYVKEIESTQTYIKEHLDTLPSPFWICTGYQSRGVGQFDRHWESKKDENILCSLLMKNVHIKYLTDIQFKLSFKLIELLKTYGIDSYFKAPNDIYASNKKMCGILVDTKIIDEMSHLIIGIGLNVNQVEFQSGLNATSMKLETQKTYILDDIFMQIKDITQNLFIK
jgi:BirA family biotin operon repressor/biotin-[acetyl-CoA-carboxylase] ligase